MLEVVAAAAADEAGVNHVPLCRPLHTRAYIAHLETPKHKLDVITT